MRPLARRRTSCRGARDPEQHSTRTFRFYASGPTIHVGVQQVDTGTVGAIVLGQGPPVPHLLGRTDKTPSTIPRPRFRIVCARTAHRRRATPSSFTTARATDSTRAPVVAGARRAATRPIRRALPAPRREIMAAGQARPRAVRRRDGVAATSSRLWLLTAAAMVWASQPPSDHAARDKLLFERRGPYSADRQIPAFGQPLVQVLKGLDQQEVRGGAITNQLPNPGKSHIGIHQ